MALLGNVPTLSFIRWVNLVIVYEDTTYQIENNHTNKPFVYWDIATPNQLVTSNIKLEEKDGLFYIIFNDKGKYTVVPQSNIELSFSENSSSESLTNKVLGFSDVLSNQDKKMASIVVDVNDIKSTIVDVKEDVNKNETKISTLEQKNDEILLEIKGIEREFGNSDELNQLRQESFDVLLSLQSTLGLFSSNMNEYMKDNKISNEEKTSITNYLSLLQQKKDDVNGQIDKIITYCTNVGDEENIIKLESAKTDLATSISNLEANINTVCIDNVITNTEITTITSYFGEVNIEINECINLIDDCILLGIGGKLIEEISNINMKQNEITFNVSRVESTINDEGGITDRLNQAEQKITDDAIINTVSGSFYNKTEVDNFIKDIPGGSDVLELEEIKNTVAQHETSINSITSRVSTIETKTTTLDGNFVSLEERVGTTEQKITDDAIVNTVVSSKKWLNATGGENYISNPTANINMNGWTSIDDSYIMRYTGIESSIPLPNIIPPDVGHDLYQPILHCIEPLGEGIGLSLLITDCTGKTIFIDGGYIENSTHCINYLTTLGITKLDYHIITHAHSDHIETGIDVLNSFGTSKTKVLITTLDKAKLPAIETTWNTPALYDEYMSICEAKGVQILNPRSNTYIKLSNYSSLTLFNTDNKDFSNYNNQSLACLYQYKDNKILLMGDITSTSESCVIGQVGKVDILQAGHHGLKDASTLKLLDELSPKHTVIFTNDLAVNGDNAHAMETVRKISYLGCGVCYGFGGSINNLYNNDFTFTLTGTSVTTTGKNCIAKNTWFEKSPGEWYWFKADGKLAKNETLTINGISRKFDNNGVCLNP